MGLIKRILMFLFIILFLGLLSYYYPHLTGKAVIDKEIIHQKESAFVIKAVDGDTINVIINDSEETVRLLGINTPEKGKNYYSEARDFLKKIENKSVELLRDRENIDRYKRKLRYVFYEDRLLNVEILENGLGTSFMLGDLDEKFRIKLINAEEFARKNKVKLWEKSSIKCAHCIELEELNPKEEFFILKNNCEFDCNLERWNVKDDANHFFKLDDLHSQKEKRYDSRGNVWNDGGDRFFMRDDNGKLVAFYEY